MTSRWSRTFSRLATFSEDLGDLGASVVESTSVRHEDIVLRRLLIAQKRAGALRFPFEVDARHDAPSTPDFVVKDTVGRRYLKVAGAGHIEPGTNGNDPCDLVVYHTDGAMSTNAVADQRAFCRAGGYGRVHVVDGNIVYVDAHGAEVARVDVRDDYDMDLSRWTEAQVRALREREWGRLAPQEPLPSDNASCPSPSRPSTLSDFAEAAKSDRVLDVENLIKELSALVRRDRRALKSRLQNLFAHLLKWQHQPLARSRSWLGTIHENCARLDDLLTESPSLRKQLDPHGDEVATAYRRARTQASNDTGLAADEFPDALPWPAELTEVASGTRSLEATFGSPEDELG